MHKENLYADANGVMVEVDGQGELTDPVRFCTQGGGFVRSMPKDKFLATFKLAKFEGFHEAAFTGDWLPPGMVLSGYTEGRHWNGWEVPYFPLEQATRMMAVMPGMRYDPVKDAFINTLEDCEPPENEEVFAGQVILVGDEKVKVYAIGAGSWCWDPADD